MAGCLSDDLSRAAIALLEEASGLVEEAKYCISRDSSICGISSLYLDMFMKDLQ